MFATVCFPRRIVVVYETAIEKYLKKEDWYMWANMNKGSVTLPVFQSLECFWPGLQVNDTVQRLPHPPPPPPTDK